MKTQGTLVHNQLAHHSGRSLRFFFCIPSYISGVHHFGGDFLHVTIFNPTIEVVTFYLQGRCMLVVFLLPAFIRLGHGCQDLLSPCDGINVCTDLTSVYTLIQKSFMEWSQNPH